MQQTIQRLLQLCNIDEEMYVKVQEQMIETYTEPEIYQSLHPDDKQHVDSFVKQIAPITQWLRDNKLSDMIEISLFEQYSEGDLMKACNILEDLNTVIRNYEGIVQDKIDAIDVESSETPTQYLN